MEKDEKKGSSSQNVLNVILVIICGAIMGLFVYLIINMNNQLTELREREAKNLAEVKATAVSTEQQEIDRANRLAEIVRQTALGSVSATEGLVSAEEHEKIKADIARNLAQNLSPIMAKIDEGQGMTNEKLDKILNELIDLLDKELKKSVELRKQMAEEIAKERAIAATLQSDLSETQKVFAEMNGFAGELKALYASTMDDDSAFGDIGRAAMCVPQFAKNALTFDWFTSTDRVRQQNKIDATHREIMDRFESVGKEGAQIRRVPTIEVKRDFFDRDVAGQESSTVPRWLWPFGRKDKEEAKPEEPILVK